MRRLLARLGIKIRRFPIWLRVFNLLCAGTLLLIVAAGVYALYQSPPRPRMLDQGRLDSKVAVARLEEQDWASLDALLASQSPMVRRELIEDLAALCVPEFGLWLAASELDSQGQRLAARWARAWSLKGAEVAGLRRSIRSLGRVEASLRLARECLAEERPLTRRYGVDALLRLDDPRGARLLADAMQSPALQRARGPEARMSLGRWLGRELPPWRELAPGQMSAWAAAVPGVMPLKP